MTEDFKKPRVAVLGLGLTGVGTVKNLVEEGFDAVGFERNEYIGGLWKWSLDETQTTAIKSTKVNISRQRSCYQDFEISHDLDNYPTAEQLWKYINDYANHFSLTSRFRLGMTIQLVERSQHGSWTVRMTDQQNQQYAEDFDKVVVTTGPFSKAWSPTIRGSEKFRGRLLHGQAYKNAQDFAGKRVVVVGLSNTGGDTAVDLCGVASKIYVSHRSGVRILKRLSKGRPVDHKISRRVSSIGLAINELLPSTAGALGAYAFDRNMKKEFPSIQESWKLFPAPPIRNSTPIMNDHVIDKLADGEIESVDGIAEFLEGKDIALSDGTKLESIDAVIFATGYTFDYTYLSPEADPTSHTTPEWDASLHKNGIAYARLYQGLFSPAYADSLAFIGAYRGHSAAAFSNADLSSQAIAQIWKGNFKLPSRVEMEAWCDQNYQESLKLLSAWRIVKIGQNPRKLEKWLNDVAGNSMNEMLGSWTSARAWRFWWNEYRLYRLIMDGIDTPYVYRLFDSDRGERGRKKWDGAKGAILRANEKR